MPLKHTYDKEADVPAEQKALYVFKKDFELKAGVKQDLWVLDVEDVVPKARFMEFRTNNEQLLKDNKALNDRFAGIEDPDRARALEKIAKDVELADAEKFLKKGGMDAIVEERVKTMKADMTKKLDDQTTRAVRAEMALDREIIQNALMAACAKLSLQPGAEAMVLKMGEGMWVRKDGQIVSLDASGSPRPSKDATSNLGIGEWLQETFLKQHPYLVKESSGGGAGGSGGGAGGGAGDNVNPWKAETRNLTKQAILVRTDPEKAKRLMVAAGVPVPA